jgi:hypothetical protein
MERDNPPTVELTDEELSKASGGSNALIDAFTQGFQKGLTEGAPPENSKKQADALKGFEQMLQELP